MKKDRLINEIKHGKLIAKQGEQVWNWSSPAGKLRKERRATLLKQLLGSKPLKLLELGCGTGIFTQELSKTIHAIDAIDISADLLDIASKKIHKKNVTFIKANAYDTKFKGGSYDAIVGVSVLHHLEVLPAFKEMYRLLRPAGKVLFSEPNMLNPQIFLERSTSFTRKLFHCSPDETAFVRWKLLRLMNEVGFRDVSITPFDFLHPSLPSFTLSFVKIASEKLENIPLVREISGSLLIRAYKK